VVKRRKNKRARPAPQNPERKAARGDSDSLPDVAFLFVFGLFGTTITLVGNVDAFIKIATWMQYLTKTWKIYTHRMWDFVFGWIGLHPPPFVKSMLTFLVFFCMLFLGTLARTVLAVRFGFQLKLTPRDVSQWEVARNFLYVCLGVSLAFLLIAADSWDVGSAYFYGLLKKI
jgi:hypothetical protein